MTWFQTFDDDFNRADGALGNGWVFNLDDPSNSINIVSDAAQIIHPTHVQVGAEAGRCYAYRPSSEILANTRVQVLLKGEDSSQITLIARKSGGSYAFGSILNGAIHVGRGHVAGSGSDDETSSVQGHTAGNDQLVTLDVVGSLCTITAVDQSTSATITLSYTPSSLPATGVAGFRNTDDNITADLDWFTVFSDTPPPLAAGAASFVATAPTGAQAICQAAANGTAPYGYQWKRSTVSGSGYSNVSGATSLSLSDSGLASATDYYYICEVTDSAGSPATADSNEVHIKTQPADHHTLVFAVVGDSIINGFFNQSGATPLTPLLSTLGGKAQITGGATVANNRAVSGTTSLDWQLGGSLLPNVVADIAGQGCNVAIILLGTNDAKTSVATSSSTYLARMTAILDALVAAGVRAFVSYPPFLDWTIAPGAAWDSTVDTFLTGYMAQLDSLHNGTTIFRIGNSPNLHTTTQAAEGTYLQADGTHLTSSGVSLFGTDWANQIYSDLFPSGAASRVSQHLAMAVRMGL